MYTHTYTHWIAAFVLLHQLFPSQQDWLVGGRGLATGAGQRNSRLFTFSLQPPLFSIFLCFPPYFSSCHILVLSIPLRGWRLWNERPETSLHREYKKEEWLLKFSLSIVALSRNAGSKMWMNGSDGGKLHAIYCSWHCNMKPATQTLHVYIHMQACTHTHTYTDVRNWLHTPMSPYVTYWSLWCTAVAHAALHVLSSTQSAIKDNAEQYKSQVHWCLIKLVCG